MTWEALARQPELRFKPSSFVNHEACLFKLKQHTSVTVYMPAFEGLLTRIPVLPDSSLLNYFLFGLRKDIHRELYMRKPQMLHNAIGMAKLIKDKCNAAKPTAGFHRFLNRKALQGPSPTITTLGLPRPPLPALTKPIKRLTLAEMAAQCETGLCYNCDYLFTKGHHCTKQQFLCLLFDDDKYTPKDDHEPEPPQLPDDPEQPPQDTSGGDNLCISFHALTGMMVLSTLKIMGKIHGNEMVILIDDGSTNNFVQSRWVTHLGLPVQPSSYMKVTVGNGVELQYGGTCLQVSL